MNKKNIIYIVGEFPSNTETFVWKEIQFMAKRNSILLIALKKGKFVHEEVYTCTNVQIIYLPFDSLKHWIKYFFYYVRSFIRYSTGIDGFWSFINQTSITLLMKEIKVKFICFYLQNKVAEYGYSHIHAHFAGFPTTVAMRLSHLLRIPFSFTAHAHDIYVEDNYLMDKIAAASFVVTCTKYNKVYLNTLFPSYIKKIHMIYHGVNLSQWKYKQSHSKVENYFNILTVGRLVEKKGFIYLLKSLSILKHKGVNFHCTIVGEGKEFERLYAYCQQKNLVNEISFTGWILHDEIKNLMYKADVFVLPSIIAANKDRDGLPNVLLEAMATGVATISTSISAIPELINNYHNGILVPEKREDELADSLISICRNENLKEHLITNARRTVEKLFDSDLCNKKFCELFVNSTK